mmetsp:Transcript_82058/g.228710  ORF Transcript_82058/g.228710 Transcript_82058/m.228710 type:complete len:94 (-) Transcript_82058:220-501(-)
MLRWQPRACSSAVRFESHSARWDARHKDRFARFVPARSKKPPNAMKGLGPQFEMMWELAEERLKVVPLTDLGYDMDCNDPQRIPSNCGMLGRR